MGDLREAVGGKDGNDKGEAVAGIIVRFRNHGGPALPEFHLGLETGNPEVLGDVKVVQKDFLKGGLSFRRRISAIMTKLLQQLLQLLRLRLLLFHYILLQLSYNIVYLL